ncbi:MAG: hypothetical protein P0S95_03190 [Rhabdochlamydiaceae bacterium]|nr:hypothetical protein [Candidatus Amphrikana amoebophyrae]
MPQGVSASSGPTELRTTRLDSGDSVRSAGSAGSGRSAGLRESLLPSGKSVAKVNATSSKEFKRAVVVALIAVTIVALVGVAIFAPHLFLAASIAVAIKTFVGAHTVVAIASYCGFTLTAAALTGLGVVKYSNTFNVYEKFTIDDLLKEIQERSDDINEYDLKRRLLELGNNKSVHIPNEAILAIIKLGYEELDEMCIGRLSESLTVFVGQTDDYQKNIVSSADPKETRRILAKDFGERGLNIDELELRRFYINGEAISTPKMISGHPEEPKLPVDDLRMAIKNIGMVKDLMENDIEQACLATAISPVLTVLNDLFPVEADLLTSQYVPKSGEHPPQTVMILVDASGDVVDVSVSMKLSITRMGTCIGYVQSTVKYDLLAKTSDVSISVQKPS